MKLTETQLKKIWQERTARATPRQAECLTQEQFERAVTGDMTSQERAQMARHLVTCTDCVEEYRILHSLWHSLQRSLRPLAEEAETVPAAFPAPPIPEIRSSLREVERANAQSGVFWPRLAAIVSPARVGFAFAALLLISLALGLWFVLLRQENDREAARLHRELSDRDRDLTSVRDSLDQTQKKLEETIRRNEAEKSSGDPKRYENEIAQLRQTIAELSRPQLDVPIIDLDPYGPTRGNATGGAAKIEAPPTASFITLILNINGQQMHPTYAVEVFDSNGKQVWRGQRARGSRDYSVNLTLARRMFPAGRYLIKLYGLRDGKQEPVAEYPVLITE